MISPTEVRVDLLPFGEINIDDGVQLTSEGMTSIEANGFMEVYQAGTAAATIETGHVFKAATLPAIILLKLLAYSVKPDKRHKDARDIADIIQYFFELQADLIYEHHNDLFGESEPARTLEEIASIVIGREMKKMCADNRSLLGRLTAILSQEIAQEQRSAFLKQMTEATKKPIDQMLNWLQALNQGLLS